MYTYNLQDYKEDSFTKMDKQDPGCSNAHKRAHFLQNVFEVSSSVY